MKLLADDDPAVFTLEHEKGKSPFFITCDHGGLRLPRRLGKLGLPDSELARHIAWDIGASAVSRRMAEQPASRDKVKCKTQTPCSARAAGASFLHPAVWQRVPIGRVGRSLLGNNS